MIQYSKLSVGDVVPVENTRAAFSARCDPVWYVLTVGRQRRDMIGASAWLVRQGASECWFPEETKRRQFKRAGKLIRQPYDRPIVPGIVFMLAEAQPQWDILLDRKRIRPLRIGDRPVAVSEAILADMKIVPERIGALRSAAEAAREAERLAKAPRAGESAEVVVGPFSGFVVPVAELDGSDAIVMLNGLRVRMSKGNLERRA